MFWTDHQPVVEKNLTVISTDSLPTLWKLIEVILLVLFNWLIEDCSLLISFFFLNISFLFLFLCFCRFVFYVCYMTDFLEEFIIFIRAASCFYDEFELVTERFEFWLIDDDIPCWFESMDNTRSLGAMIHQRGQGGIKRIGDGFDRRHCSLVWFWFGLFVVEWMLYYCIEKIKSILFENLEVERFPPLVPRHRI